MAQTTGLGVKRFFTKPKTKAYDSVKWVKSDSIINNPMTNVPVFEQKGVEFHYQPASNLPTAVHADDKRLRQVLLNLLSNAVKFTDFGTVTFRVEVVDAIDAIEGGNGNSLTTRRVRFQIKDTGIGIAPEKLGNIFLPFEQAGKRDRNSEGTGLGLAISQQIIQKMGSNIQVESRLGQGSTFWFEIDLLPASNWTTQNAIANRKVIGYQGERCKILVIDDGSTDKTTEVLAPVMDQIRYIKTPNGGVSAARNHGIRESEGEWIAFLESDDTWEFSKLARQWATLSKTNSKACFCASVDEQGEALDDLQAMDAMRPVSWVRAFQAWQHASTICS